jgi:hypothetical protein
LLEVAHKHLNKILTYNWSKKWPVHFNTTELR